MPRRRGLVWTCLGGGGGGGARAPETTCWPSGRWRWWNWQWRLCGGGEGGGGGGGAPKTLLLGTRYRFGGTRLRLRDRQDL